MKILSVRTSICFIKFYVLGFILKKNIFYEEELSKDIRFEL